MDEFKGPWRVIASKSLQETPKILPGEIMRHQAGVTVLACPRCGATQFVAASLIGSDDKPSLRGTVKCGGGFCTRCGKEGPDGKKFLTCFTITDGETRFIELSPRPSVDVPEKLVRAGVKKLGG